MTVLTTGIFLAIIAIYTLLWIVVRWNRVAVPERYALQVQIDSVRARAQVLEHAQRSPLPIPPDPAILHSGRVFRIIEKQLEKAEKYRSRQWDGWDWIFWSRGHELSSWRYIHDAERLLVQVLPEEQLDVRLVTAGDELLAIDRTEAKSLAKDIAGIFTSSTVAISSPPSFLPRLPRVDIVVPPPLKRALLVEALRLIYDERDNNYGQLDKWYGKSLWFFLVALLIIIAAGTLRNPDLLLVGAIGGFLSRLQRAIQQPRKPNDYGVSWSTLFLSPLMGAIGAWAGILLISALVQAGLLSGFFTQVTWNPVLTPSPSPTATAMPTTTPADSSASGTATLTDSPTTTITAVSTASATATASPTSATTPAANGMPASTSGHTPIVLGLALLLGFSERLFDTLSQRLEQALSKPKQSSDGADTDK